MARSYWRLLLNTLPRLSKALASLGSSRTAALASASARSSRPTMRRALERSRKARALFGSSAMARSKSAKAACVLLMYQYALPRLTSAAASARGAPSFGIRDHGGAGGDALLGREGAGLLARADVAVGVRLRQGRRGEDDESRWQATAMSGAWRSPAADTASRRSTVPPSLVAAGGKKVQALFAVFSFKCGKRSLSKEPW